ncbi:DNA adenine methylase [Chitinophaga sp. CC14]|uniref:DNA adenine methylase n=1 Tax=Chitinophaga sp. CC14 TaxID=3029199 RepID=UPI003B7BE923
MNQKKMKPPFSFYGGKQRLAPIINTYIPPHYLYGELFAGSAALFFLKHPSPVEVLNDTNGLLINFFKVVTTRFEDLRTEVIQTLSSRRTYDQAVVICKFPELFDPVKQAWAIWLLCNQGFAGKPGAGWGFDRTNNASTSRAFHARTDFVYNIAKRLEKTQLENADALYILKARDSAGSFFYLDPPYINTAQGPYSGYRNIDYQQLLNCLATIKGKFLLSSFPTDLLSTYCREQGWHQKVIEINGDVSRKSGRLKSKSEVITTNYPLIQNSSPSLFLH